MEARASWRRDPPLGGGREGAYNFCAALEKVSFGRQGLKQDLQTFEERSLWERGVVWGAGGQELGTHGMEVGPLGRLGGAGR